MLDYQCHDCGHDNTPTDMCQECGAELPDDRTPPIGIESIVCDDIAARQAVGIKKYGTTVADNPLSLQQWLQHAYEECLDQAIYLRRAIEEINQKKEQSDGT